MGCPGAWEDIPVSTGVGGYLGLIMCAGVTSCVQRQVHVCAPVCACVCTCVCVCTALPGVEGGSVSSGGVSFFVIFKGSIIRFGALICPNPLQTLPPGTPIPHPHTGHLRCQPSLGLGLSRCCPLQPPSNLPLFPSPDTCPS